jgi:hypothetical protein
MVMKNPQAMETCLGDYFQSIASFPTKSLSQEEYQDIQGSFQQVCCPLTTPVGIFF